MAKALPHREVFRLAIPMLISGISVPLFGIVDTAILGHLDSPSYLAAVALGATVVNFLLWGLGFLRMGTTSLAAREFGKNDGFQLRLLINQALILAGALGLLLIICSPVVIPFAVNMMQGNDTLSPLSEEYIQIRLLGAPATLMGYAIIGWFIGLQNTRVPLIMALFANSVNILMDVWLVIGLEMASRGAAIASLCGDLSTLALGAFFVWRQYRHFHGQKSTFATLKRLSSYRNLLLVNRHLFIRTLFLLSSLSFFTAQGARQGELILAANAILMQLVHLSAFALDGFAHATEAMVGKAVGRQRLDEFMLACKTSALWSMIIATFMTAGFHVFQEPLTAIFTQDPELIALIQQFYPWVLLLPVVSAVCYFLDGLFIGAGRTQDMQTTMIMASILIFLPTWWLTQPMGNHGLWMAFCAFNGARGLFLAIAFYRRQSDGWEMPSDRGK